MTPVDIGRLAADAQSLRKSNPSMAARVAAAADEITRLRDLLPQPTPTVEPVQYNGHNGLTVFADAARRLNEGAPTAQPHRIEGMAPGTTFTEEVRWTITGTLSTGMTVAHSAAGEMRFADRFDPSTIRDVTPHKEQS